MIIREGGEKRSFVFSLIVCASQLHLDQWHLLIAKIVSERDHRRPCGCEINFIFKVLKQFSPFLKTEATRIAVKSYSNRIYVDQCSSCLDVEDCMPDSKSTEIRKRNPVPREEQMPAVRLDSPQFSPADTKPPGNQPEVGGLEFCIYGYPQRALNQYPCGGDAVNSGSTIKK